MQLNRFLCPRGEKVNGRVFLIDLKLAVLADRLNLLRLPLSLADEIAKGKFRMNPRYNKKHSRRPPIVVQSRLLRSAFLFPYSASQSSSRLDRYRLRQRQPISPDSGSRVRRFKSRPQLIQDNSSQYAASGLHFQ